MTLSTHTTIGAAIGFLIGNPVLGFALGAASHFLVDMIPHGDSNLAQQFRDKTERKKLIVAFGTVDAIISMLIILGIFSFFEASTTNMAIAAAIAGSILPDLLIGLYELKKSPLLKGFYRFHFFFHDFFSKRYGDVKLHSALVVQAIFIAVVLNTL